MITKDYLVKAFTKGKTQKEVAKDLKVKIGSVEYWVKKHDLHKFKERFIYTVDMEKMTLEDPYFCYLLGLFVSDGYYSSSTERVEITLTDREPLETLSNYFNTKLYHTKGKYILIFPKAKCEPFKNVGFTSGPKTFTVNIDNIEIPEHYKYLFIRGMIDGDGTLRKNKWCVRLYSESKSVLDYIGTYYKSKDWSYSINNKVFRSSSTNAIESILHIYEDFPELSIPRKRKIVKDKVDEIVRTYEMINHKKW